jgi:hypothetical protein
LTHRTRLHDPGTIQALVLPDPGSAVAGNADRQQRGVLPAIAVWPVFTRDKPLLTSPARFARGVRASYREPITSSRSTIHEVVDVRAILNTS